MKFFCCILVLLLALPGTALCAGEERTHLVISQNGGALMTELRDFHLPQGRGRISFHDLPATCEADSFRVRSKTGPGSLEVQDVRLAAPLTPAALLRRFVGKKVTLLLPDGTPGGGSVRRKATPLSAGAHPIFRIGGRIYAGPYAAILYPGMPAELSARPRLDVTVENRGPSGRTLELTCLVGGLVWRMNYVLDLDEAGSRGTLSGWAAIDDRSGADFHAAGVELLAGGPDRGRTPVQGVRALIAAAPGSLPAAPLALFEYRLYRLPRPLTLTDGQTVLVPLFAPAAVPVTRHLLGQARALPRTGATGPEREPLSIVVSFENTTGKGLGIPLPGGELRAYEGTAGRRRFLGRTGLCSTPAGAPVALHLDRPFDMDVERTAVQNERIGKHGRRASWKLRIRNAGKQPRHLVLQELIPGNWKVERASHKWTRPSAGVLEFSLDVPPTSGKPLLLAYTFRTDL